ncbi:MULTISPECIES: tautomerase family protein [Pandoraea]|uniref:tautomerase family protein n=1 Tax=Pandoraea TaxID=93217 RepID=UPI00065E96BC|nr:MULTISPECIES: tautomerase family protein [Pandoraea]ALS66639.1 4-oxalocrotonate tautomerase [Pandoraea apista]
MPNIEIFIVEGYSDRQKADLIATATAATASAISSPLDSIRIWLTEIPANNFGVAGRTVESEAM